MIKLLVTFIYLSLVIVFCASLVEGVINYTEVQRTEVSFKAKLDSFVIEHDASYVNITIAVTFENPSNRDISLYNLGLNLYIFNSSWNSMIKVGQFYGKAMVYAGDNVVLNMSLKVDRNSDNRDVQSALQTMQLDHPGVERMWWLGGSGDYYILPYNFWYRVDIGEVIWK